MIAQFGKVIVIVCRWRKIPLIADSAAAFVGFQLFADLADLVDLVAAEIFANVAVIAVVVAVLAVVFVSVVTFVWIASGSGSNAVLAFGAVVVVTALVVGIVVDAAASVVGGACAVVFAAEFAVSGASVSGFPAAEGAVAAAEVAAEFDSGDLFGCCLRNSHFARICYHGTPDNSLLPSFASAARRLTERAEALMCSQW